MLSPRPERPKNRADRVTRVNSRSGALHREDGHELSPIGDAEEMRQKLRCFLKFSAGRCVSGSNIPSSRIRTKITVHQPPHTGQQSTNWLIRWSYFPPQRPDSLDHGEQEVRTTALERTHQTNEEMERLVECAGPPAKDRAPARNRCPASSIRSDGRVDSQG